MNRVILSASTDETILAVTRQHKLVDLEIEQQINTEIVGCIYKGIVKNIVPAVDGIFVDIGIGKNAFLRRKDLLNEKRFPTEGSPILAQVIKSDTDMKGALITEKISMLGKYAVTLSGTGYIGVSKKIRSESVRERLKETGKEICAEHMGLIIRTAAENADMDEFRKDIIRLKENWDIIQKRFRMEKSPTLLYRESDIILDFSRTFKVEPLVIPNLLCFGYELGIRNGNVPKIYFPDTSYSGEVKNYLNEIGFFHYANKYGLFEFCSSPYSGLTGKKIDPICGTLYFDTENTVDEINRGVELCIAPFADEYLYKFECIRSDLDQTYYVNDITEFLSEIIMNCSLL